jgi:ribosomal protein S18 acetylase RimI-like enzyme
MLRLGEARHGAIMPSMDVHVRPARREDRDAPGLLYVSAAPYYDAYAGSTRRAERVLRAIWARPGHTASFEVCRVAEAGGPVAGVMVCFPSEDGDRLARRFLSLSLVRLPPWRWPAIVRHLRASATVTPMPLPGALYVDALAVAEDRRRQGIARRLLEDAEQRAAELRLSGVALDTGLQNGAARALYEAHGFRERARHPAPDERTARIVGGPGFVSYFKPL